MTCGITVVTAQMYEIAQKTVKEGVIHSPILERVSCIHYKENRCYHENQVPVLSPLSSSQKICSIQTQLALKIEKCAI